MRVVGGRKSTCRRRLLSERGRLLVRTHSVPQDSLLFLRGWDHAASREGPSVSGHPRARAVLLAIRARPAFCLHFASGLLVLPQERHGQRVCGTCFREVMSCADEFPRMIRLPGDTRPSFRTDSGTLDTLASIPWFVIGVAGVAWEAVSSTVGSFVLNFRSRRGYRTVPVDGDAQILRFEDEE